ncbi:hypothetical protein [Staphylococcus epidermidis]|uniref:hypothetical protein n=1 Tax=Staphylococcus epidermidis TaxID=1282 RepID=UPI00119E7538|nr:hypothetical protein [Staphylococcus epidermidis]
MIEEVLIVMMGEGDRLMLKRYRSDGVGGWGMIREILMVMRFVIRMIDVGRNIGIVDLKEDEG